MDVHPRDKVFNLEQHQSWTFPYGNMLNLYQVSNYSELCRNTEGFVNNFGHSISA